MYITPCVHVHDKALDQQIKDNTPDAVSEGGGSTCNTGNLISAVHNTYPHTSTMTPCVPLMSVPISPSFVFRFCTISALVQPSFNACSFKNFSAASMSLSWALRALLILFKGYPVFLRRTPSGLDFTAAEEYQRNARLQNTWRFILHVTCPL